MSYFNFTYTESATLGHLATLELHIMRNRSTTTLELIIIQLHVDSWAGVAVEGQDIQEGN